MDNSNITSNEIDWFTKNTIGHPGTADDNLDVQLQRIEDKLDKLLLALGSPVIINGKLVNI